VPVHLTNATNIWNLSSKVIDRRRRIRNGLKICVKIIINNFTCPAIGAVRPLIFCFKFLFLFLIGNYIMSPSQLSCIESRANNLIVLV